MLAYTCSLLGTMIRNKDFCIVNSGGGMNSISNVVCLGMRIYAAYHSSPPLTLFSKYSISHMGRTKLFEALMIAAGMLEL